HFKGQAVRGELPRVAPPVLPALAGRVARTAEPPLIPTEDLVPQAGGTHHRLGGRGQFVGVGGPSRDEHQPRPRHAGQHGHSVSAHRRALPTSFTTAANASSVKTGSPSAGSARSSSTQLLQPA